MDTVDVIHRDDGSVERRGLVNGLVSDLFGGGGTASSSATATSTSSTGLGGLLGGVTGAVGSLLSISSGSTSSSSTVSLTSTSSSSPTASSSSSSSASSSSASSSQSSSTSSKASSSSATSSSSSSSSTSASTTAPPPSSTSTYVTSTDGNVATLTTVVEVAPATSSSAAADASVTPANRAFLQNKPLEGAVFGIVGLIALIVVLSIATFALRKARKNRLHAEAMKWPDADGPGPQNPVRQLYGDDVEKGHGLGRVNSTEKGSRLSSSSSGSIHGYGSNDSHTMVAAGGPPPGLFGVNGYGQGGYGALPVPPAAYPQQQMVYNQPPPARYLTPAPYGGNVTAAPAPPRSVSPAHMNPAFGGPMGQPPQMMAPPPGMDNTGALPRLDLDTTGFAVPFGDNAPAPGRAPILNAQQQPSSLLNSPPHSPTELAYGGVSSPTASMGRKRQSSHAKGLNPDMPPMPQAPALPDTFGADGRMSQDEAERVLKVTNH